MTEGVFDISSKQKIEEQATDPLEGMTPEQIIDYFMNEQGQ